MRYIRSLIYFSPVLMQLLLAAGTGYVGLAQRQDAATRTAAAQELLAAAPPATVPVAEFVAVPSPDQIQELSVSAQVAADPARLLTTSGGEADDPRLLVVLTDPDAAADASLARAAILVPPGQKDAIQDWLASNATKVEEAGQVVAISGLVAGPADRQAAAALKDQGMTMAPGFFFIEPFLLGREAGYQTRIDALGQKDGMLFLALAGFFLLVGVVDLVLRIVKGAVAEAEAEQSVPMTARDRFAKLAELAAEAESPEDASALRRGPSQADYLTVPTDFTKGTFDHVSWSGKTSSGMSLPRLLAILVLIALVGLQLAGGTKQMPDIFAHPERLFVGLKDRQPVEAVPVDSQDAPPSAAEAPLASPAPDTAAADAAAYWLAVLTGREELPLSTVALLLLIGIVLFVVRLRWKANRILRKGSRGRPAAKIYVGDRSFRA